MLLLLETPHFFFSIILAIGAATIFTDFKERKIRNSHLLMGAIAGVGVALYGIIFRQEDMTLHFIGGATALVAGICLHHGNLCRGGDAKLFALYAFLMPATGVEQILFLPGISLFAATFITGTLALIPLLINNIILNRAALITVLRSPAGVQSFFKALLTTLALSWVLFPLYGLTRFTHNPAISFVITYIFFSLIYQPSSKIKKDYILQHLKHQPLTALLILLFGFLCRWWLAPGSLNASPLFLFLGRTVLFSAAFFTLHAILEHLHSFKDRVPLAPLLLAGCLLSYTPFLLWVMRALHR